MRFVLGIVVIGLAAAAAAQADPVYVRPHIRSDGTYVPPHYRTSPDSSLLNNYSTRPNYNPYSGRAGTVDPFSQPYRPSRTDPYALRPSRSLTSPY